jgi:hypothetical protein
MSFGKKAISKYGLAVSVYHHDNFSNEPLACTVLVRTDLSGQIH